MPTELDHAYGSDGDVAVIRRGDIAVLKVKCLHTRDEDPVLAKIRIRLLILSKIFIQ